MAVRQTVVSDTNSPKTATFAKLRGVDYSSSPFEVSSSRATSMRNMINEDGVNHKRHGWTEDLEINKKISEMNITNIKGIYMSSNTKLKYIIATDSKIYSFLTKGNLCSLDITKNSSKYRVKFVTSKNKIIIFYPSAIYSFDLDSEKYEDSTKGDCYVPTTTISINPMSNEDATRKSFEDASLLNEQRKNTMLGIKESEFQVLYFTVDYSLLGNDFSYIENQCIYILNEDNNSGQQSNTQTSPDFSFNTNLYTKLYLADSISSFPLRSVENEITMAFKFEYSNMLSSFNILCKVFDSENNMLYSTKQSVLGNLFTVNINQTKSLKIVYETEGVSV